MDAPIKSTCSLSPERVAVFRSSFMFAIVRIISQRSFETSRKSCPSSFPGVLSRGSREVVSPWPKRS